MYRKPPFGCSVSLSPDVNSEQTQVLTFPRRQCAGGARTGPAELVAGQWGQLPCKVRSLITDFLGSDVQCKRSESGCIATQHYF